MAAPPGPGSSSPSPAGSPVRRHALAAPPPAARDGSNEPTLLLVSPAADPTSQPTSSSPPRRIRRALSPRAGGRIPTTRTRARATGLLPPSQMRTTRPDGEDATPPHLPTFFLPDPRNPWRSPTSSIFDHRVDRGSPATSSVRIHDVAVCEWIHPPATCSQLGLHRHAVCYIVPCSSGLCRRAVCAHGFF